VRTADELIERIVNRSQIPSGKRRREIQRELRSHIDDVVVAAREVGRDEDEVERLVLSRFGDPVQIAQAFSWVYRRERRMVRALCYTLSTMLLAGALLAAVLALQAGLAFGLGRPITKVLASRHTVIEAFDILTSVAAYLGLTAFEGLFEGNQFQKAAFLLTGILGALIVTCSVAGLHASFLLYGLINAVFFRALQLYVTPKMARLVIVLVCFALAGLVSALLRARVSETALAATCVSWLVMGAGYQLMTHLATRLDVALLNGLHRIQASY
jgi:hypothetical protein